MNFQDLVKIEKANFYIDLGMRKARERTANVRGSVLKGNRLEKSKKIESARMDVLRESYVNSLERITRSFPSIDDLPEFYKKLIKIMLDYSHLKKCLGAVSWSKDKIIEFHKQYTGKMRRTEDLKSINKIRNEFLGRASSAIKQIKKELVYLEDARRTMKGFPAIKELPTIAIAGFPNVGKSTLLRKITKANPEISNYAFTTKKLNLGTLKINDEKLQFIDTPGTLNRKKMNFIEMQADLALKYLANVIVYIFDATESYTIKEQEKLLREIKKYDKPTIIYISKIDTAPKDNSKKLIKKYKAVSYKDLLKEIEKKLKE